MLKKIKTLLSECIFLLQFFSACLIQIKETEEKIYRRNYTKNMHSESNIFGETLLRISLLYPLPIYLTAFDVRRKRFKPITTEYNVQTSNLVSAILNVLSGTKNDIRDKKRYQGQQTILGTENDIRVTYRFYVVLLST